MQPRLLRHGSDAPSRGGWPRADGFAFVRPPDLYGSWLHETLPAASDDPRFEVRRARVEDFEAIYDLVDEAFGRKRPRARFDWLYRRNPGGLARCWTVRERESRKLVSTVATWPWPLARGEACLPATLGGDAAVAPRWQRQGVPEVRRRVAKTHPDYRRTLSFSWPNVKTRGRQRKHGRDARVMGPLWRGERRLGHDARWPRRLGRFVPWRAGTPVEPVRRFDATLDPVTWRWMGSDGYWSPHDAAFLNWRYLEHPDLEYHAFCLPDARGTVRGYCVVGIDGPTATLMELAAPREPAAFRALADRAAATAREAGCDRVRFFATPRWAGWPPLRAAGFRDRSPGRWIMLRHESVQPSDSDRLALWQLLPGDNESV